MQSHLTGTHPHGDSLDRARGRLVRLALPATATAIAAALALTAGSAEAKATSRVTAQVKHGTLIVNGSRKDDNIALRVRAATPNRLDIDVGDNGSADIKVRRNAFQRIAVQGNGGRDRIRIDDAEVAFTEATPTTLDGGPGADTLLGGRSAETFLGGSGNDFVDANGGNDVAFLGRGDDRFQWDPGDGSDVVEGQQARDELVFNGAGAAENFSVSANGQRVRFFRDVGAITIDLGGVEKVTTNALGGADTMTVNDLSGTDAQEIRTDLAGALGGTAGDAQADRLIVNATGAADTIAVKGAAGAVDVIGLSAKVALTHGEASGDTVTVNSLGGTDTVDASGTAANTLAAVALNGGDLDDVLIGSAGKDALDGDRGNDVGLMGAGDDTFTWDPGDGSDTVEGQAGADTLRFNGAAVAEKFDVSANGQRVRFTRDVGNITIDLDDVENVTTNALGGADTITVNDLSGTDVTAVDVDLAGVLGGQGGDGQVDRVIANATNGPDAITVAGADGAVDVTGLPAAIGITNAEATDELVVNGLGGADSFDTAGLAPGTIALSTVQ
jgi:Ca2+-binding RTX toxin-like protein